MSCVQEVGSEYGLALNWKKVEALPVRCEALIQTPKGNNVEQKESMQYLGALLSADVRVTSELGRRIGLAHADVKTHTSGR